MVNIVYFIIYINAHYTTVISTYKNGREKAEEYAERS